MWTGSNNFTQAGTHFDEVMMRIPFASALLRLPQAVPLHQQPALLGDLRHLPGAGGRWTSSPGGGARAYDVPEDEAYDLPPGTPVITTPEITFDENGEPVARD